MNNYMEQVKFFADNENVYWFSIYLPIILWMTLIFVLFVLLLRKYTFGNWTADHVNPYEGETFNMPRGVMRGLLSLSLLYVTIIIELANVRIIGFEDEFHQFMIAFQMMIAFYFGSKVMHHIASVEKSKSKYYSESNVMIEAGTGSPMGMNQNSQMGGGDFPDPDSVG